MAQTVELENGEVHEFPDDASQEEITSVVNQQFPHNAQPQMQPEQKPQNLLQRAGQGVEQNFNEPFRKYIGDPIQGFAQGTVNALPGLMNLGIGASNKLYGTNVPKIPELNAAPQTTGAQIGNVLSDVVPIGAGVAKLAGKGINAIKGAISSPKNALVKNILDTHDALENKAVQGFETVSNEINKRGITNIPVESNVLNNLKDFFSRTKQNNALIDKAKSGDYNSLRKIQSDLYTKGNKSLGSPLASERDRGEEMLEHRDEINQAISNHLLNTGHTDLSNTLNQARNDYRILKDVYYNPKMNRSIINMVDKNTRKIPKNLANVLQEESKPMQALRDFHPDLEKNLSRYNLSKNALLGLKKYVLPPALLAAGALGGIKYMESK